MWRRCWTDWTHYACQWQTTATSHERCLCARLLIPLSLINTIPHTERHKLRAEVGLFQFRIIQAVQALRQKLADPTPQQPPSPLWLTRFIVQPLPPREAARNLRDQVGAPLRYPAWNRKRKAAATETVTVDVELWLQAAHAANDGEAVTWFTNIHRSQKQIHGECTSKRRCLNNLAHRWEHYLSLYDKLAVQHAHRAFETYRHAQVTETTLQHVRELHAVYAKTLTAKQDYHLLVTNLLKEHIEMQQHNDTYTALCLERRQWYEQAKHYTMQQYANAKMSLLSHERFARLRTDTALLLTAHSRQARYALLQQERITQLAQDTAKAYQLKETLYWDAFRQARQTIYFARKRTREQWDPTLWEVPLQPLPKRQKAHRDPNEWEIPLT